MTLYEQFQGLSVVCFVPACFSWHFSLTMYLFPLQMMSTAEIAQIVFINVSEALKASDMVLTECSLTKSF